MGGKKKPQILKPAYPPSTTASPVDFDWDKALSHIQASDIALFSVVSRCTVTLDGETLRFYTGNTFYKKKLDTSNYRANLTALLETLGMTGFTIETIGTIAPPKDTLAASVAAIMGGGEEYAFEETEEEK